MPDKKTEKALKIFKEHGQASIALEQKRKKRKKRSTKANKSELLKMLIKGKRYKMSRKAEKRQKSLGKKRKETAAGLLTRYARGRK